ncbi:uncharacterized protein LOC112522563 isoform X1 [Cynara cardunculus var. scolymus]|uniref:uncharacterized protein LOC112522563 isoform X1 n=1 Tax=Cynara cardunculus var. scolymus TaxID=59895 RepID=UPI000D627C10|nr:uncharacterized protein LOC112522563 isoform X1 [Cynara cardunculus var. scolymus]
MSLENEDGSSAVAASESVDEPQKKPRISYTRDFLLSLSELEICKTLPSGFDRSLLSEFEDNSNQERQRSHGSLPLQSFRRNDYSSSPPTRGDSSNFSRGVYGRWDNRSSGWSDKDGDSQSDLDPDNGRRSYGNQSRRPWQNSEHDGLLGSGSFPRPSGIASGTSAPKGQTNEPFHLNRSNEAYQPPRPFKAVPHTRTNTQDSFNDETFGSSEFTSQDRAEEERKRRASFELMRKEQQKVLQEKQKSNANKHKSDGFTDLILEETKEEGVLEASGELNSAVQSVPNDDSLKSSILLQSSKSRPLVPPGFRSTILEKGSTTKPISSTNKEQNPKPGIEEIHLLAKGNHTQNGTQDNQGNIQPIHKLDMTDQYLEDKNICGIKQGEAIMTSLSGSAVETEKRGIGDHNLHGISGFPEVHEAVDGEVFELMTNNVMGNKILSNSSQESTTSILGKFFGSGPTVKDGGSTGFLEQQQKSEADDHPSPHNVQSSRFAQWFNEDEKKPVDDVSSNRPNDLLSLIVGSDKTGSQVPNVISSEPSAPDLSYKGFGVTKTPSDSKHLYNDYRQDSAPPVAAVLTCEDLEQTIMSEYSEKSTTLQPPIPDWSVSGQENMDAIPVDNRATHHLLSLLQKGTTIDDMKSSNTDSGSLENRPTSEVGGIKMFEKPKDANQEAGHTSAQNLSLEALFGTAFMKELQSAQAPVSVQRGSAGSARINIAPRELSAPVMNGPLSSSVDGIGSNMTSYESNTLSSKEKQPVKSDDAESWLNFNGPQVDVDPLEFHRGVPKLAKQASGAVEIQLPEEESLITVGDPANTHNPMSKSTTIGKLLPSDAAFDISEKLAALNSGFRGERSIAAQEANRFVRGPYDMLEPERQFNNLHAQASSPQMHAGQMNHNRLPMFHPLDPNLPHMNSHMRFPEHLMQRDSPLNHQFPANMARPFHHPDARVTGFDVPAHPQMMPQMRMQGNFPPHLLRDLPRPSMVHPHPGNQASNFMPDREALHGFPFAHQQANIGGLGMPLPVGDGGPEALQRMMEMEVRAQSKQVRPVNSQGGMYELDMGFRYR